MSPMRACVLACLLGCGCTVDLLVDDGTGPVQASSSSDGDTGIAPAPSSSEGTGTSAAEQPATTDDGTTVALDEGTSTGTGTEGPATEGTATEGTTTEATTAGEIPCPGLGYLDCSELSHCLWYGTPKMGECALSPCENLRHDCWTLPFEDCQATFPCAWVGEPRVGECAPIECVPCELLGLEQCMEIPTCEWSELEELCLPA